jgi:hypothetical protein
MKTLIITGIALLLAAPVKAEGPRLAPILDPYLRIQQALSADTLDAVLDSASGIIAAAAKLGAGGEAIGLAGADLRQATGLPEARTAFDKLGRAIMIAAAESADGLGDDVKVAYCPMARKYWLQKGQAIRNPYYGQSMLECGRFVAKIPDLKK